jgi:hypothetical protein
MTTSNIINLAEERQRLALLDLQKNGPSRDRLALVEQIRQEIAEIRADMAKSAERRRRPSCDALAETKANMQAESGLGPNAQEMEQILLKKLGLADEKD